MWPWKRKEGRGMTFKCSWGCEHLYIALGALCRSFQTLKRAMVMPQHSLDAILLSWFPLWKDIFFTFNSVLSTLLTLNFCPVNPCLGPSCLVFVTCSYWCCPHQIHKLPFFYDHFWSPPFVKNDHFLFLVVIGFWISNFSWSFHLLIQQLSYPFPLYQSS